MSHRAREYTAIGLMAFALFLFLCLISFDPRDPSFNVATTRHEVSNACGLIGSHVADSLVQMLGLASILIPLGCVVLALQILLVPGFSINMFEALSTLMLILGACDFLERLPVSRLLDLQGRHAGGAVGMFLNGLLGKFLGGAGEVVLVLTLMLLSGLYLSKTSVRTASVAIIPRVSPRLLHLKGEWVKLLASIAGKISLSGRAVKTADANNSTTGLIACPVHEHISSPIDTYVRSERLDRDLLGVRSWERLSFLPVDGPLECGTEGTSSEEAHEPPGLEESPLRVRYPWRPLETPANLDVQSVLFDDAGDEDIDENISPDEIISEVASSAFGPGLYPTVPIVSGSRPIRVSKRADEERWVAASTDLAQPSGDDYQLPPLDLLDAPQVAGRNIDEKLLESNARVLEQKLADLGIQGEVVEIHPGPVITMYELALASGIPLRKVLSTSDDLAMALKSGSTRVVAPIPGKDTVGIEVPNLNREIVYFREIIESPAFTRSSAPLKLALGKGIDGEPFATSLVKMPHLLIAGATGTGKSVGLNSMICSWLMSCHPDDVKFLMVDPKKLELSYYQDIPHLIHPVVTDADKVPKVLSWAIREMERRYDLLSKAGAKNIEGFNQQVASGVLETAADSASPEKLPYLIIIIDELAELMMVAAKDIEISIARLAQMARASGIHLILATQRPSVDVITGVIKANFPARISYQVSARPDSRTILDTTGAENLLGMGDMLFLPPGTAKMRRLHGAYVSENEIRRIADFIKAQRSPVYLKEISRHVSEEESRSTTADFMQDEKYDEAVELVTRLGHASISLIQRHMRIGYNRAARIIEVMESEGIIGPSDGTSRPREVLVGSLNSIPDSPSPAALA